MKKYIRICVFVLLITILFSSVAQAAQLGSRTLRVGASGEDVSELQTLLKRLGYFNTNVTGYYGNITKSSVLSFQSAYGLSRDGIAGSQTTYKLKYENGVAHKSTNQVYIVQTGDTLWIISQRFSTTVELLQQANGLNTTTIYAGQKLVLPTANSQGGHSTTNRGSNDRDQSVSTSYQNYIVKSGDSIWSIANSFSLPQTELMKANGFNSSTVLYIGQSVKIPVINVPVKATPGSQYGELLDWWSEAQYVLKFNVPFTITDFYTGTEFKAVRTYGANHADCEPLTSADTSAILKLWNTNHSSYWTARPVIININGRKLAASMTASLHAGLDSEPNGVYVNNRSGDYGYGQNFDAIKGNGADGHFDIHFLNSTTHGTGVVNKNHQNAIRVSAGK